MLEALLKDLAFTFQLPIQALIAAPLAVGGSLHVLRMSEKFQARHADGPWKGVVRDRRAAGVVSQTIVAGAVIGCVGAVAVYSGHVQLPPGMLPGG